MRRLLWVTALPPALDAGGGGQIRQAHLISALTERFEVGLLVAGTLQDDRLRSRLGSVEEIAAKLAGDPSARWRRRVRDLWWLAAQRRSDEVARHAEIRRALGTRAAASEADVVCVEYVGLAPILPSVRDNRWALTLHNLTSVMAEHGAAIAPGSRQRAMLALEARNARRVERWAVGAYDLVSVVSPDDAAALPGTVVVPNGVDLERFEATAVPDDAKVVFTGALHTLPNRDGMRWFCIDVWPRVRSAIPHAELLIVGADPPDDIRALDALPGVSVHADVPDVRPFLERARVAVAPLRIGTGSRLKALEAMAAGRPVVGTSIGLGGLSLMHGRDALIADRPEDLAASLVRCLRERDLVDTLARGGRLVAVTLGWAQIGERYADLLEARCDTG